MAHTPTRSNRRTLAFASARPSVELEAGLAQMKLVGLAGLVVLSVVTVLLPVVLRVITP